VSIGETAFPAHDFTIIGQSTLLPESENGAFRFAGDESFHRPSLRETDSASAVKDLVAFKIWLSHSPFRAIGIGELDMVVGFGHRCEE